MQAPASATELAAVRVPQAVSRRVPTAADHPRAGPRHVGRRPAAVPRPPRPARLPLPQRRGRPGAGARAAAALDGTCLARTSSDAPVASVLTPLLALPGGCRSRPAAAANRPPGGATPQRQAAHCGAELLPGAWGARLSASSKAPAFLHLTRLSETASRPSDQCLPPPRPERPPPEAAVRACPRGRLAPGPRRRGWQPAWRRHGQPAAGGAGGGAAAALDAVAAPGCEYRAQPGAPPRMAAGWLWPCAGFDPRSAAPNRSSSASWAAPLQAARPTCAPPPAPTRSVAVRPGCCAAG